MLGFSHREYLKCIFLHFVYLFSTFRTSISEFLPDGWFELYFSSFSFIYFRFFYDEFSHCPLPASHLKLPNKIACSVLCLLDWTQISHHLKLNKLRPALSRLFVSLWMLQFHLGVMGMLGCRRWCKISDWMSICFHHFFPCLSIFRF